MSRDATPPFAAPFTCTAGDDRTVTVRHEVGGHRWRYAVAEKNGRLQLVHLDHAAGPAGLPDEATAIDAYDVATREARRRGWVD